LLAHYFYSKATGKPYKSTDLGSPKNSASSGSATTSDVQAQTLKEAGAAESFSLVTFFLTAKKKVTLSAAIPEIIKFIK
jgi:hypothetical protein